MSAPPAEAWYTPQPAYAPHQGYQHPPDYAAHQGYPPQQEYPPPQQGYPPPQGYPPQHGYPPQGQPFVASYQYQPLLPPPGTLPPITTATTVQQPSSNVIVVTTSAAPAAARRPQTQRRSAQRPPASQKVVRNVQEGVQPPDHMVYAIIVTIFCCLPCGALALMRSSSVRSRFANGDYEGAQRSSLSAKRWSNAGLICGTIFDIIIAIILLFCYVILPAFAGLSS